MNGFWLPRLIVPESKADQQQWAEQVLRYISFANTINVNNYDTIRYAYALDNIPTERFNHILNLYGGKKLPAFIRKVNPIPTMLERLIGEAMTQNVTFTTQVNDQSSVSDKFEQFGEQSVNTVATFLRQQSGIDKIMGQHLYDEDAIPISEEEVMSLKFDTFKNEWEELYQCLLEVFQNEQDINFRYKMFHQVYYSMLVCNKCAIEQYQNGDSMNFRTWDARKLGYSLAADSPYLQDAIMVHKTEMYTLNEIIQNYPDLSYDNIEELKKIEGAYLGIGAFNIDMLKAQVGSNWNAFTQCFKYDESTRVLRIKTVDAYWRADAPKRQMQKNGDFDMPISTFYDSKKPIHDYNCKCKKCEAGTTKGTEKENVYYLQEVWRGTMFGWNMYYGCTKIEHQLFSKDNPTKKKLPITGIIIEKPSFVDLTMDLVDMRLEIWRKLELLWAQPMGKKLWIDKAAGGDIIKNIYNLEVHGIGEYDSSEVGYMPNSTPVKEVDTGGSIAIQAMLMALAAVDSQIMMMSGLNDAAAGALKDYTSNGVANQQLQQSQLVNVSRLDNFYTVVSQTLQQMCDMSPYILKGKTIQKFYFNAEHQRMFVNLTMPKNMEDSPNIAVNIEYSASDMQIKQAMIASAQQVLPIMSEPKLLSSIFKMIKSGSSQQAIKIFDNAVAILDKEKEAAQQAQAQQQQAALQAQMQSKLAPTQIQTEGRLKEKQIQSQTELQKQSMKNHGEGMRQDAAKRDDIDLMVAQKHIEGQQPTQ
jgi:hypothetical protein